MFARLLLIFALVTSAVAVGCALTVNVAIYRVWTVLPAAAFAQYHQTHERQFVPLAVAIGVASVCLTLAVAWRGVARVPRGLVWASLVAALLPWLATPIYFIPLQGQAGQMGPTAALVSELENADLALRVLAPVVQCALLLWALAQADTRPHSHRGQAAFDTPHAAPVA